MSVAQGGALGSDLPHIRVSAAADWREAWQERIDGIMVKGRCECGTVSFEIEGSLTAPTICHCGMCRRLNGAPGASTRAPRTAYRITGEENLNWFRSSADAERGFCRLCGSKLFWREDGSATLDVTTGSLDAPTGLVVRAHIWARHQGDYYEIDKDGVLHFA